MKTYELYENSDINENKFTVLRSEVLLKQILDILIEIRDK